MRRALKIGRKAEIAAAEAAAQVTKRQRTTDILHTRCLQTGASQHWSCRYHFLAMLRWLGLFLLGSQQLQGLALSTQRRLHTLVVYFSPKIFQH